MSLFIIIAIVIVCVSCDMRVRCYMLNDCMYYV